MRVHVAAVVIVAALCTNTAFAVSRVTFERTIPAPQNPGAASDLALVYAIGDNQKINTFLDSFVDQTNRSGTVRMADATGDGRSFFRGSLDAATAKRIRRRFPADLYVRVNGFSCRSDEHAGDAGAYDADGKRIRRKQRWVDATCTARLELINAATFVRMTAFNATGQGTSPREPVITPDIVAIAVEQAARYAGVSAAELITPRRVRESILLIEDAPRFAEGMAMIDAGRPEEARRMWEEAARRQPSSAGVRFNLAAVCESIGDVAAAMREYQAARKLAPAERRFRDEFEMFRRRNGVK
jgi:hypothetical protein